MRHALTRMCVASHNSGKIREITDLLAPFGVKTVSAAELGLEDPEETGLTFAANAELKARAAADASNMPALSDDSGLAVDALDGAPGIYSARYAELPDGSGRDFSYGMTRLYEELREKTPPYTARFVCALSLAFPHSGKIHTYEGTVEGEIIWPPRGGNGFGYDPIFLASGDELTFGELPPADKHAKSHRADAFTKFMKAWF